MRVRFTLSDLFGAMVLAALSLAVFGLLGILVAAALVGLVANVRKAASTRQASAYAALTSCSICLLGQFALAIPSALEYTRLSQCRNNLKMIGLCLMNYQDEHRSLSAIGALHSTGRPRHSWQLLLVPYMEGGTRTRPYGPYNISESWNSPNNGKLATMSLSTYECPSDQGNGEPGLTHYVAVVKPNGTWLGPSPGDSEQPNPVWVIEVTKPRPWTEPRDISLEELCEAQASGASRLSNHHIRKGTFFYYEQPAGAPALFADGTVRQIPRNASADVLRAALLGDRQKQAELERYHVRRVNWPNMAALASLVAYSFWMSVSPHVPSGKQPQSMEHVPVG